MCSGSEEFVQVYSSDNRWKLAEHFDLSLSWGFVIHGWNDSMFKDPNWTLNGKGIYFKSLNKNKICLKVLKCCNLTKTVY